MDSSPIIIRGARQHNLKNVDLDLPRGTLAVFTGVSGSGKSSLAFDTLYAEGHRRYVESLSSYARQFLGQLEKPLYSVLRGLSPTIAIEQGGLSSNPRSTVGTVTEILDYLRVLFARVGVQHCPTCDTVVHRQSAQEIVRSLASLPVGTRYSLLAPRPEVPPGQLWPILQDLRRQGYARARLDGTLINLDESIDVNARVPHHLELVVDRLVAKEGMGQRLTDSVETTLRAGDGRLLLLLTDGSSQSFTERPGCPSCGTELMERSPQLFSFNHPTGMCPDCQGLGTRLEPDLEKIIPNPALSLNEGAILPWATAFERQEGATFAMIDAALKALGIDPHQPYKALPARHQQLLLYGAGDQRFQAAWESTRGETRIMAELEGVVPLLLRRMRETKSEDQRKAYAEYMSEALCTGCQGQRLRREALAVRLGGHSLAALLDLPLVECDAALASLGFVGNEARIAEDLIKEVRSRLRFLLDVGLEYLTLSRRAPTLSGGEAQRIRLASQLGSELTGVLYVLDEPSVGLHPRDTQRLLGTLKRLRDLGNTVLVVEHDRDTIATADFVADFGPGAGEGGGELLYAGNLAGLLEAPRSLTGAWLSGARQLEDLGARRTPGAAALEILGAQEHNLQNIDVRIPLGLFVGVTGVSGAGKSTLINEILYPALASHLHNAKLVPGAHRAIAGLKHLDKVIHIDQEPIGRSPRSNPATYTKVFDLIRRLFAQLPDAKVRGYSENRFSFNVKGGRCEACQGEGARRIEMHFLPDVYVTCEVCHGHRFNEATLEILYKDHSIADVLEHSVEEMYLLFRSHPQISHILFTLLEVGLGYLKLGQSATTLSGGEAQRIKLARELARPDTGRTLYLLDEPTTGLHFEDVARLLRVLKRLVDQGNTVLVIEHSVEVLRSVDWLIDLGPEGGAGGGQVVVAGPPELVAACEASHTGRALREAGVA